jgi:uncharacterized membrane protein YqhA
MKSISEKSRFFTFIPAVCLLFASLAAAVWGAVKTFNTIALILTSAGQDPLITFYLIQLIDVFLISIVLYIFAVNIYELFIGKLQLPEWMLAHNLHQLKTKLTSVIILVMAVKFLEYVVEGGETLKTLYLAISIAVVSAVLIAFSYFGEKD